MESLEQQHVVVRFRWEGFLLSLACPAAGRKPKLRYRTSINLVKKSLNSAIASFRDPHLGTEIGRGNSIWLRWIGISNRFLHSSEQCDPTLTISCLGRCGGLAKHCNNCERNLLHVNETKD